MVEAREFYADRVDAALKNLESEDHEPVYMPEVIDARIAASKEARIWQPWLTAPRIKATGRTKQGNPVVVYAHIPNYFSKADNITTAINQGLVNYAGRIHKEEFQRLLDSEDKDRVFVVDYDTLRNSTSGVIEVKDALKHPQTIPFLAGEERAVKYLERHKEVYGDRIGNWYSDDLRDEPLACVLCVDGGLDGDGDLGGSARFLGVRAEGAKIGEATQKILQMQSN